MELSSAPGRGSGSAHPQGPPVANRRSLRRIGLHLMVQAGVAAGLQIGGNQVSVSAPCKLFCLPLNFASGAPGGGRLKEKLVMCSLNDIRGTFIDFFRKKNGHEHVPSRTLVPRNDPTLMFTNAALVQFKNVFTGKEKRPFVRAVTGQKCVRAGGKHNDLDNVGYTARHHTFFEMLGIFVRRLLQGHGDRVRLDTGHKGFGLDKKRLRVTVSSEDDKATCIWRKVAGLPEIASSASGLQDNFWSMGRPAHAARAGRYSTTTVPKIPGGPPGSADEDGDRFIGIWNLVFMQYEQVSRTSG